MMMSRISTHPNDPKPGVGDKEAGKLRSERIPSKPIQCASFKAIPLVILINL